MGFFNRIGAGLAAGVLASIAAPACAQSPALERAVLAELNFARTQPQAYARMLMAQPVSPWEKAVFAKDAPADPQAFQEAVDFLMSQAPLPALEADAQLGSAADDHATEQGEIGAVGHNGRDGERFDVRLRRHGVMADYSGENIAYGPSSARDIVRELIIDPGVASRGHRRNIFYGAFASAGVACGPHKTYDSMCVIDFASRTAESEAPRSPWSDIRLVPVVDTPALSIGQAWLSRPVERTADIAPADLKISEGRGPGRLIRAILGLGRGPLAISRDMGALAALETQPSGL